jgi:hypothetical protein
MLLRTICLGVALAVSSPALAKEANCLLPRTVAAQDDAVWKQFATKGQVADWIKYFASAEVCHRDEAQMLFSPLIQVPKGAKVYSPGAPDSYIPNFLHVFASFSGLNQQDEFWPTKGEGEVIKSRGSGGHLYIFKMFSTVRIKGIPKHFGDFLPTSEDPNQDIAFRIHYDCWSFDVHLAPLPEGECHGPDTQVMTRVNLVAVGPYAKFFDLEAFCLKDLNQTTRCEQNPPNGAHARIYTMTINLKPKLNFRNLLSDGY